MVALATSLHKVTQGEIDLAFKQLAEFVAIPSLSNIRNAMYDRTKLIKAADYATGLLQGIDFKVRQVTVGDSVPYILAEKIVDAAKPTLLLYGHYDIQPVDIDQWETNPFVLTERDGRLYGRGSSDDKGGIIAIITALGAYQKAYDALPCNIKILFEGEEEFGSSHMGELLKQEQKNLAADALVVMDGGNAAVDLGTLTNSTRGLLNMRLEVRSMKQPIHSGVGCIAPDPSLILAKLMTSLEDPAQIPGFMDDCIPLTDDERILLQQSSQSEASYILEHDLHPKAPLRGHPKYSVYERISELPSISFVNGGWGTPNGGNSIQPTAYAQVGIRLTPGQNPEKIAKVLNAYISSHPVGDGFEVTMEQIEPGCCAWKGDLSLPFSKLYLEALKKGFDGKIHVQPTGGALPLLNEFQAVFPKMEMIVPGVEDPKCAAHSHNESQDIGLFVRAVNSLMAFIHSVGKV